MWEPVVAESEGALGLAPGAASLSRSRAPLPASSSSEGSAGGTLKLPHSEEIEVAGEAGPEGSCVSPLLSSRMSS